MLQSSIIVLLHLNGSHSLCLCEDPSFTARKSFVRLISPVPSTCCVVLREACAVCRNVAPPVAFELQRELSTRFGTKVFSRVLSLSLTLKPSAKFSKLLSECTSNFHEQDYFPGNRYLVNYHVVASIIAVLPLQ